MIAYNDAARLPNAINSVLSQSLQPLEIIIVDDASTDGTMTVASDFAQQYPHVRVFRHRVNSGGCGAPRNTGLAHARGDYVMFLDSDDEYHSDACEHLVRRALQHDADIVSGVCIRRMLARGKNRRWRGHLYTAERIIDDLDHWPDLLEDAICTNKLYRRGFLMKRSLSFLEGRLFEDILFTAQAYSAARRLVVIPETVYYWNDWREHHGLSISADKTNVKNLVDRLEVLRSGAEYLLEHGRGASYRFFLRKSIEYDVRMYLDRLPELAEEQREEFVELTAQYFESIEEESLLETPPLQRARAFFVMRRHPDKVAALTEWMLKRGSPPELESRGGRLYLSSPYLDDPDSARFLELTYAAFENLPVPHLECVADSITVLDDKIVVTGQLDAHCDSGGVVVGINLALRVSSRSGSRYDAAAVQWELTGGRTVRWRSEVSLPALVGQLGELSGALSVRLHVSRGQSGAKLGIECRNIAMPRNPAKHRNGMLTANRWTLRPYVGDRHELKLRLGKEGWFAQAGRGVILRAGRVKRHSASAGSSPFAGA